jgi:hypothetical protein
LKKINYANKAACPDCPIRSQCTRNSFRMVSRLENEAVLDRMDARMMRHQGFATVADDGRALSHAVTLSASSCGATKAPC